MSLSMVATGADLQPLPRSAEPPKRERIRQENPRGYKWPHFPPMALATARHYADKIAEWIAPHCRQIQAVGAIRRRCATTVGVELLVIPRFEENANLLFAFLDNYVSNEPVGAARWLHSTGEVDLKGLPPAHFDKTATLFLPKCKLTLHVADADNWFLRLFETTGSTAHVQTIMERVRSLPGTWEPGEQVRVRGRRIVPKCEGDLYDALNMSLVVPWRRFSS